MKDPWGEESLVKGKVEGPPLVAGQPRRKTGSPVSGYELILSGIGQSADRKDLLKEPQGV